MKKGISFMLTAVFCAALLTACGDSNGQSGDTNTQSQPENSSAEQSSQTEDQDHEATAEAEGERAEESQAEELPEQPTEALAEDQNQPSAETGKTLVVYYSASGNTRAVAETIAQYTEGDIFEIVPVEAYTEEDLNWRQEGSRVNREHDDESLQDIELVSTTVEDFDSYDTVFIGYPIWWHEAAWVVNHFVTDNDFTGKTVIPFCTSSSSGLGESGVHLAEMAGTGDWQEGVRFGGGASESEVTDWLEGLDL